MANLKTTTVWGLNEKGEVVAAHGTGSNNIVGSISENVVPVDEQGRLVIAGLGEVISAKSFGVLGGGIVDDGERMEEFFASDKNGYIPAGVYLINSRTLTVPHPKIIRGAGRGRTVLIFENLGTSKDAIRVLSSLFPSGGSCSITDMSIVVKGAHGKSGITHDRGSSVFAQSLSFHYERLEFKGTVESNTLSNLYDYSFVHATDIADSTGVVIRDVNAYGSYDYRLDPSTTSSTHAAFYFSGISGQGGVLMPIIEHCFVHYYGKAVEFGHQVSQPHIINSQFHRCYIGIDSPNEAGANGVYGSSEVLIHNVNINAQFRGIRFAKSAFVDIGSVRVTRANGGFNHAQDWIGFDFNQVDRLKLIGGRAYNEGSSYTNNHIGVSVVQCDYVRISDIDVHGIGANGITKGYLLKDNRYGSIKGANFLNVITAYSWETASSGAPEFSISHEDFGPTGTVTNRHVFESGVDRKNIRFLDRRNVYEGVDASTTGISAAGVTTLVRGVDNQLKRLQFNAGSVAYNHDVQFSNVNATADNRFDINITLSASTNPTVRILDAAGTVLHTFNNTSGVTQRFKVEAVFGTAWRVSVIPLV